MIIYDLTTDGRPGPLEIDSAGPVFSWRLRSELTGDDPVRARIVVERVYADGRTAVVWDESVPGSDTSVTYGGRALEARASYRWTVSIGATHSTGEATGLFETGLRDPGAWTAAWITRDPRPQLTDGGEYPPVVGATIPRSFRTMYSSPPSQVRYAFDEGRTVQRARLYVSARGIYRAWLNGHRVGQDELTPGWTRYESRLEYQAYDVTSLLEPGRNALAAVVGDGWWSGYLGYNTRSQADQYGARTEFIAELFLEFDDGTSRVVATGDGWKESAGVIVMSDLLMGEYHDPSRDSGPWTAPGFDDSAWRPVVEAGSDTSTLSGQLADPVRALMEVPAVRLSKTSLGNHVIDFGQNLVGRVRLQLRSQPPGSVVELLHGEMLDGDSVYTANLRTAESRDVVVTMGTELQVFEPLFTLHGFRYLELRGLTGELRLDDAVAVVLGSDTVTTGGLSTGNDLVNQLHSNIVWGQRGNYVSVPTDCPQRDERLGWTADTQVFARTAVYNNDVHAFLDRWLRDLVASQDATGRVPDVAPVPPTSHNFDAAAPGWGDAVIIVPWTLYETYGDRQLLARNYPHMRAWVEYVAASNTGTLWDSELGNNYGDWLSVGAETPKAVVAAAYRIRSVDLLAQAASELGFEGDVERYRASARNLRQLFVDRFVDDDDHVHGRTQSSYLFALAWDLLPEERRARAADHLVDEIEKTGRRLTTGFLGVNLLCPVLERIGRQDLAVAILLQREFPSWGYSIDQGATTIWERWDGWTESAGFQAIEMNSFNHYSLGSVGEWLYRSIGGIGQAAGSVGFRTLRIAPLVAPELGPVSTWFESPRGRIEVAWEIDDSHARLTVLVPPGTTAGVLFGDIDIHVGSGRHHFITSAASAALRGASASVLEAG
jgi:alpha-L-rhamnosidase